MFQPQNLQILDSYRLDEAAVQILQYNNLRLIWTRPEVLSSQKGANHFVLSVSVPVDEAPDFRELHELRDYLGFLYRLPTTFYQTDSPLAPGKEIVYFFSQTF